MPETPVRFDDLLAPLSPEVFFRDYWERLPLVQRRPSGGDFGGLFSVEAMDQIVSQTDTTYPAVWLARDGSRLPRSAYAAKHIRPALLKARVHAERVIQQYRQGVTIQVMALERNWLPVARFCRHLEEELGFLVQAHAFLSPPNLEGGESHQGLKAHYDTQEQFVLQVSGRKRWRLYDNPVPLPLLDEYAAATGATPGDCLQEEILEPGDVIYLPRGTFHEAITLGEHSLHLTIEIFISRWIDALKAALQALTSDPRFRESVPRRAITGQNAAEFARAFEEIKALAFERLSAADAIVGLRQFFLELRHPLVDGRLVECVRSGDGSLPAVGASPDGTQSPASSGSTDPAR